MKKIEFFKNTDGTQLLLKIIFFYIFIFLIYHIKTKSKNTKNIY